MSLGRTAPSPRTLIRAWMVAAVLAASLFLAACSGTSHYQPDPAALQDFHGCSATAPFPADEGGQSQVPDKHGSVPEGLHPYRAVQCTWDPVHNVIREDHLDGDITDLLAALAEPSERGGEGVCNLRLEMTPELWLVNTVGEAANVQWPTDHCGKAKPGVSAALDALSIMQTAETPVARLAP
ncbi:hypothetical protein [Arthrobacter glacialis]|nr:hypothetical protein [Arthrobacter glacialis]